MAKILAYIGGIVALLALLVVAFVGQGERGATISNAAASALRLSPPSYDFGRISMAAGVVRQQFTVENTGASPVTIAKLFTSCMCTRAALTLDDKTFGPYGMPGHGAIPRITAVVPPGGRALLEVTFDPAAHGPAGIGRVARAVTLENDGGAPVQLSFSATVVP